MDKQPIVEFKDVSLAYGEDDEVLHDVNFKLAEGSFHFLTGASGAGKSSLLKLIYLGNLHYSGTIKIFNKNVWTLDPRHLPEMRLKIGVVFQEFHLLDHLSAVDNVSLPLRIMGLSPAECYQKAADLLEWVGLGSHLHTLPKALSGGQQQRVVIARAVTARPRLLLADEPTGNVDDKTAVRLMDLFENMNKVGTTVVLATHNRDLVFEFPHEELAIEEKGLVLYEAPSQKSLSSKVQKSLKRPLSRSVKKASNSGKSQQKKRVSI